MQRKLKRLQKPRKGIQYIVYPSTRKELSPFVFFDAGTMQRNDDGLFIDMRRSQNRIKRLHKSKQ